MFKLTRDVFSANQVQTELTICYLRDTFVIVRSSPETGQTETTYTLQEAKVILEMMNLAQIDPEQLPYEYPGNC